jgi:superfamily I DNA and/or RNA helicase
MLLAMGVQESKIGIITPYRAQLHLMGRMLKGREKVEVHTIDKYQGRDKACVIVSLVRSNPNGNVSFFFGSWFCGSG